MVSYVSPIKPRKMEGGEYCVAVVSEAEARFFSLEPVEFPELESGPKLELKDEIENPEKRLPDRELFTEAKTGRGRAPRGGPAHGYDDHRSRHHEELDKRFSREAVEKAKNVAKAAKARQVIMAAPPKMLGILRDEFHVLEREGLEVVECPKDMAKLSSQEIHERLAKDGLLPPRKRPGK